MALKVGLRHQAPPPLSKKSKMNNPVLPIGWIIQYDPSSGRNFYVDTSTGISHWHLPSTLSQNEQLPSYEQAESQISTSDHNGSDSFVVCPICSKTTPIGIINEHIDSGCKLESGQNLGTGSQVSPLNNQVIQQPYGSGNQQQQYYGQVGGVNGQQQPYGHQQAYGNMRPYQNVQRPQQNQASSRPNRHNRPNNGLGGAGLGLALGGGLLGGFLLGDMLGGDGGFF